MASPPQRRRAARHQQSPPADDTDAPRRGPSAGRKRPITVDAIIETAFGHRKHNLGFRRFSMRGLPRVTGEWTFAAAVDNLTKIHSTGWQPA